MGEERGWRDSLLLSDGLFDGSRDADSIATTSVSSSPPTSSSSESSSSNSPIGGANYIEHRVSKNDTLAGIAITYGIEVADIKRLNGLDTDLEMFAHKSLQIPLPGRHPPSRTLNGSVDGREQTLLPGPRNDVPDLLPSIRKPPPYKISPAMSSLQEYYGLTPPAKRCPVHEWTEMSGTGGFYVNDVFKKSPSTDQLPNHHRKSRSLANGFSTENRDDEAVLEAVHNNDPDQSIRRRQKTDGGRSLQTPELLLKEENRNGFTGMKGKGLALRPKAGSWTDVDGKIRNGDTLLTGERFVSVRKSSSTSCLQGPENNASICPTSKWALRPDGLPKTRMNKAALD